MLPDAEFGTLTADTISVPVSCKRTAVLGCPVHTFPVCSTSLLSTTHLSSLAGAPCLCVQVVAACKEPALI